jgi:hypothetical protein
MGGRAVEGTGLEKRTQSFFWSSLNPDRLPYSLSFKGSAKRMAESLLSVGGNSGGNLRDLTRLVESRSAHPQPNRNAANMVRSPLSQRSRLHNGKQPKIEEEAHER